MRIKKIESPQAGYDRFRVSWPGPPELWKVEYKIATGRWMSTNNFTPWDFSQPGKLHRYKNGRCVFFLDIYRHGAGLSGVRAETVRLTRPEEYHEIKVDW